MDTLKNDLKEIGTVELKEVYGGGILAAIGVAAAIAAVGYSGAYFAGYYDGKEDCLPPPCK